jgi:hypothetical protein
MHGEGSGPAGPTPAESRSAVSPALVRKRVSDPTLDETYPIGVFSGMTPTGAQLLGDEQYAPAMHCRTTFNYRRSLSENARIEEERRQAWAERLAQLKGRGLLQ